MEVGRNETTIRVNSVTDNAPDSLWKWFPVAIKPHDPSLLVDWRFVGDRRFADPFFQDTLDCTPPDQCLSCRMPLNAFSQFDGLDCLEPSAFIFHASRCGSTLMSQLLATSTECIVISEAPVIDSALNLCHQQATDGHGPEILKGILRAFGQRRCNDERHLFVKLDSWHISLLPWISQVCPDAPSFFLYRHPAEILLSHRRQRGSQMVPGQIAPDVLGVDWQLNEPADLDGFCLKVIASFFRSARRHAELGDLRLINYTQLPELIWTKFARLFSISQNDEAIQLMRQRSSRHSKHSNEQFSEKKKPEAKRLKGEAIDEAKQCYDALEQLRLTQDPW